MVEFTSEKVTDRIRRIRGYALEQVYLIEGSSSAALIDTGCGLGDLKSYVEQFTDKEITVILTHGHVDHALGAAQFDTVYMNHRDLALFKKHSQPEYRELFYRCYPAYDSLEPADRQEPIDAARFRNLEDGQTFDLGGISLQIFDCPGHTQGSETILIPEERILLTGDACNPFTYLFFEEALALSEYEDVLKDYRERVRGLYDRVLFSHGFVEEPAADIIDRVIEACEIVKRGESAQIPWSFADGAAGMVAKKTDAQFRDADGVLGNVVYNPERL